MTTNTTININGLPAMQTTFSIDIKGEDTGKHFEGDFTYKRLNIRDRTNVSLYHAKLKLNEKNNLSEEFDAVLYMIAYLKYGIIESPQWWKDSNFGLDLYDINPIVDIFNKTQDFEKTWQEEVHGKTDKKQ